MRMSGGSLDRELDVAIDATPLLGAPTGVGAFCAGALRALTDVDDLRLRAFAVSWRRSGLVFGQLPDGVAAVDRPMPAKPVLRAWRTASFPPIEWWTGRIDVVHGTNIVVPPARRAARVVTVHDVSPLRYPQMADRGTGTFFELLKRAIRDGSWVHTPSRFVRDEVIELLGAAPERVRAVHHGIPPVADWSGDASKLVDGVPDGPYVLALGTIEPRKDVATLVRAFDRVAGDHPDLSLVLAGSPGWDMEDFESAVASARWRDRVVRLGYVSEPQRSRLLRGATLVAYPSLYEGFGFPPLEAMVAGVPVVATTAGALPEVIGDGAELVAPGDTDLLAAAIERLLVDDAARTDLIERGQKRIAAFSWEECAAGLTALYRDARAAASG